MFSSMFLKSRAIYYDEKIWYNKNERCSLMKQREKRMINMLVTGKEVDLSHGLPTKWG